MTASPAYARAATAPYPPSPPPVPKRPRPANRELSKPREPREPTAGSYAPSPMPADTPQPLPPLTDKPVAQLPAQSRPPHSARELIRPPPPPPLPLPPPPLATAVCSGMPLLSPNPRRDASPLPLSARDAVRLPAKDPAATWDRVLPTRPRAMQRDDDALPRPRNRDSAPLRPAANPRAPALYALADLAAPPNPPKNHALTSGVVDEAAADALFANVPRKNTATHARSDQPRSSSHGPPSTGTYPTPPSEHNPTAALASSAPPDAEFRTADEIAPPADGLRDIPDTAPALVLPLPSAMGDSGSLGSAGLYASSGSGTNAAIQMTSAGVGVGFGLPSPSLILPPVSPPIGAPGSFPSSASTQPAGLLAHVPPFSAQSQQQNRAILSPPPLALPGTGGTAGGSSSGPSLLRQHGSNTPSPSFSLPFSNSLPPAIPFPSQPPWSAGLNGSSANAMSQGSLADGSSLEIGQSADPEAAAAVPDGAAFAHDTDAADLPPPSPGNTLSGHIASQTSQATFGAHPGQSSVKKEMDLPSPPFADQAAAGTQLTLPPPVPSPSLFPAATPSGVPQRGTEDMAITPQALGQQAPMFPISSGALPSGAIPLSPSMFRERDALRSSPHTQPMEFQMNVPQVPPSPGVGEKRKHTRLYREQVHPSQHVDMEMNVEQPSLQQTRSLPFSLSRPDSARQPALQASASFHEQAQSRSAIPDMQETGLDRTAADDVRPQASPFMRADLHFQSVGLAPIQGGDPVASGGLFSRPVRAQPFTGDTIPTGAPAEQPMHAAFPPDGQRGSQHGAAHMFSVPGSSFPFHQPSLPDGSHGYATGVPRQAPESYDQASLSVGAPRTGPSALLAEQAGAMRRATGPLRRERASESATPSSCPPNAPTNPLQCEICGNTFARKSNLLKHRRSVHATTRKHVCGTCGYAFKRYDHLNKHSTYSCCLESVNM